jgi:hypothetical protein
LVERGVVHDSQEPGAEAALAPVAAQAVIGAQQRVLAHIIGLMGADDPSCDAENNRAVAIDQFLEGGDLAVSSALHENGVFVRHGRKN